MFALAFALRGTLTVTEHLEREAFVAYLLTRSAEIGTLFDEDAAAAAAETLFPSATTEVIAPAHLAQTANRLLGETIAEPVVIARFRQIADGLAPSLVASLPGTHKTLERIASLGIPMAVLCNGWTRIARREAACAGFTGPVLASEEIGVEKPARGAFEELISTIGLPAEYIWFVGNDPRRDIDGAARAGLTTIWLNPGDAAYPTDLTPPSMTFRSIDQLLAPVCEEYTRSLLSLRHLMRTALEWREGHFLPPTEKW